MEKIFGRKTLIVWREQHSVSYRFFQIRSSVFLSLGFSVLSKCQLSQLTFIFLSNDDNQIEIFSWNLSHMVATFSNHSKIFKFLQSKCLSLLQPKKGLDGQNFRKCHCCELKKLKKKRKIPQILFLDKISRVNCAEKFSDAKFLIIFIELHWEKFTLTFTYSI